MIRTDETWHRLLDWTYGQEVSERLAMQIVKSEGFSAVDPSHPLGGRDGGRDGIAYKDGVRWLIAAYFPLGRRSFARIKAKLKADAAGVTPNGATRLIFVTNQPLALGERGQLAGSVPVPLLLLHLERVVTILDHPTMYGVREQFLKIPMPGSAPGSTSPELQALEVELRTTLQGEFGFLSTRGLPRDLRHGEPRLPMDEVFVPLRAESQLGRETIREALDHLSYRERRVLEYRLGLEGSPKPRNHIGRVFNVTVGRIAQIESAALDKLARVLSQQDGRNVTAVLDKHMLVALIRGGDVGVPVVALLPARRLVVLGGPGSGKSTLTRYLTWAVAGGLLREAREMLPFRISLADFSRALSPLPLTIFDFVLQQAGRFAPVLLHNIEKGRMLLILDGLDEVTHPSLAGRVQDAINSFLADSRYSDVSLVITSRVVGFHPEGLLAGLPAITLAPFNIDEKRRFLSAWFAQLDGVDAKEMTNGLMHRLESDRRMSDLASSPLLLTVLALLQARNLRLPNERAQLYAAATETLMHSWPLEQRNSELSYDTVPRWLAPLARKTFLSPQGQGVPEEDVVEVLAKSWQSEFGGTNGVAREQTRHLLEALRDDSGLLSVTGHSLEGLRLWDFLHRSFAEYLVARNLAEAHISDGQSPGPLLDDEAWREVTLMMLGELGRRRVDLVGPLLERHAATLSRSWESPLRRNLRLALTTLARDVPCEERYATTLLDEALDVWATTSISPLRKSLGDILKTLSETRYGPLLVLRADLRLDPPDRLALGLLVSGSCRIALLASLLDVPGSLADDAAIAILDEGLHRRALVHVRRHVATLTGRTAARAAEVLTRHDRPLAIAVLVRLIRCEPADLAEQAAKTLSELKGARARAAMEDLLDLYRMSSLEPVVERLSRFSTATRERMLALADTAGPRRLGALLVLHRMQITMADSLLATTVLAKPNHPDRLWAARVLRADPQHKRAAEKVLTVAAARRTGAKQLEALKGLLDFSPESAVSRLTKMMGHTQDSAVRLEIIESLGTVSTPDALEAIASTLGDDDPRVVRRATKILLLADHSFAVRPTLEAILDSRLDVETGLSVLISAKRKACLSEALRLLRRKNQLARRLGARVLALDPDAGAGRYAAKLVDDPDPTVRCAAVWTLILTSQRLDLVRGKVDQLLVDVEPIDGPLFEVDRSSPSHPVYCCADAAYHMLDETAPLNYSPLERRNSPDLDGMQLTSDEIARELGLELASLERIRPVE